MGMDAGLDSTGQEEWDTTGQDTSEHGAAGHGRAEAGDTGPAGSPRPAATDLPDPRKLAEDRITLWQSELSAMAADPEIRESWQTIMALWAGGMSAMLRGLPREQNTPRYDSPRRRSGAADASRTPAAAAPPDPRDAEIERLARHVAALERQLAELARRVGPDHGERGGDPQVDPKRPSKRGPPRKPRG